MPEKLGSSVGQDAFGSKTEREVLQCLNVPCTCLLLCNSALTKRQGERHHCFGIPGTPRSQTNCLCYFFDCQVLLYCRGISLHLCCFAMDFITVGKQIGQVQSKRIPYLLQTVSAGGVQFSIVSTVAGRISPYWYHLGSIKSTFFIWRIQVQMSSYFWLVLPWTWLDR